MNAKTRLHIKQTIEELFSLYFGRRPTRREIDTLYKNQAKFYELALGPNLTPSAVTERQPTPTMGYISDEDLREAHPHITAKTVTEREPMPRNPIGPYRVVAVFNINDQGALVMRLVESPIPSYTTGPYQTRTVLSPSEQGKVIREVQDGLPSGQRVVGITNEFPSEYGNGGVYVYPVKVTVPAPKPSYNVKVSSVAKTLEDLTTNY